MTLRERSTVYKHTVGDTFYLTIPARLAQDSQFPFKPGDSVIIRIDTTTEPASLRIEKLEVRG